MWTQSAPTLRYDVSGGERQPLLLLHEIGGSRHSWNSVVARLAGAFTLVRFDQRGFGDSEKPRASYSSQALVDDAWRVLDAAGASGPVGIVAAAAACTTAVAMARMAPDRVCGLVLCAPALHIDAATRDAARARADLATVSGMAVVVDGAMAAMYPAAIRDAAHTDYAYTDYYGRFRAADPVGFALAYRAFADAETGLDGLETPALVLAGTHDVRPVDVMSRLATGAVRARMEVVADAGHVMAVQQPAAVAGHIAGFFGVVPGDAGSRSVGGE